MFWNVSGFERETEARRESVIYIIDQGLVELKFGNFQNYFYLASRFVGSRSFVRNLTKMVLTEVGIPLV